MPPYMSCQGWSFRLRVSFMHAPLFWPHALQTSAVLAQYTMGGSGLVFTASSLGPEIGDPPELLRFDIFIHMLLSYRGTSLRCGEL